MPSAENARAYALKCLARRALSEAELHHKLVARGYAEADIDDAMNMLRDYRYLDDAEFAATVVREASRQLRGPAWVSQTLRRRGVQSEQAAGAHAVSHTTEAADAARALRRRLGGEVKQLDAATRRRAIAYLCRRGFSASIAIAACDALDPAHPTDPDHPTCRGDDEP